MNHTSQTCASFMGPDPSYGAVWPKIEFLVRGFGDAAFLEREFSFYKKEWKNRCLREVAENLSDFFGARGSWYRETGRAKPVLGTLFRPARSGLWFVDGRSYDVFVNARKRQPLTSDDASFLARAMYELHGRDDPNDPGQLIIDVSSPAGEHKRQLRSHNFNAETAISLEKFEQIMRAFFEALTIAGFARARAADESMRDMFRR